MTGNATNFFNPQSWLAAYQVDSVEELPNRDGAAIQTRALAPNMLALVAGAQWYCCLVATLGAARWFSVQSPFNPLVGGSKQAFTTHGAVAAGVTDAQVTNTGDLYVAIPTELDGFPEGRSVRIWKTSTDTGGIVLVPGSGDSINGGTPDAFFGLPGSNTASSDTTSDGSWVVLRTGEHALRVTGGQPVPETTVPQPLLLARAKYNGATGAVISNSSVVYDGLDIVLGAATIITDGIYTIPVTGTDVPTYYNAIVVNSSTSPVLCTPNVILSGADIAIYWTAADGTTGTNPGQFTVYLSRGA